MKPYRFALRCLLFTSFAVFVSAPALVGVPVFPGAVGFGTQTAAGRGGTIYYVDNLSDHATSPAAGSLRAAVNASGTRVILFRISGVIHLHKDLNINNGNLTIAGQTAPAPGITLEGAGISIRASNVLIQHLAVRPGNTFANDEAHQPPLGVRDAIKVENATSTHVSNIVIDHVSCSWATDENFSVWGSGTGGISNVTLSNSFLAEALDDAGHPDGNHSAGLYIAQRASNVSLIRNISALNKFRNPHIAYEATNVQVVNNLIYAPGEYPGQRIQFSHNNVNVTASVKGNPIILRNDSVSANYTNGLRVLPSSNSVQIYLDRHTVYNTYDAELFPTVAGDWWNSSITSHDGRTLSSVRLTSEPSIFTNLGVPYWTADIEDNVKIVAGSRSGERDTVDAGLITHITNRTGNWRNAPGTYPTGGTTRSLTIPDDHNAIGLDGYTNLERWLHGLAADLEGHVGSTDPLNASIGNFDTFSDGNDNGWNWNGTTNWTLASGAYRQSNTSGGARALLEGTNWTDQVVEAKVKPVSFDGTNRFAAVYARYRDINNGYYVALRNGVGAGNLGTVELKKVVNGTASNLTTAHDFAITAGTTYKVRLVVSGTSVSAVVTNLSNSTSTTFSAVTDTSIASGRAALGTYRASADFDDVFASPFVTSVPAVTDDFDDGNSTGWDTTWTGMAGSWSVVADGSNGLRQSSTAANVGARAMAPDLTNLPSANQSIQADVKPLTFTGNSFVGLYARYASPTETYYLILRNTKDLEIKKITSAGQVSFALKTMPTSFSLSAWHTLRFVVTGTSPVTLQAYVDGTLELTGTDSSSPIVSANKAGVGTFSASAHFDDIAITSP
jgi:hypothetical protein